MKLEETVRGTKDPDKFWGTKEKKPTKTGRSLHGPQSYNPNEPVPKTYKPLPKKQYTEEELTVKHKRLATKYEAANSEMQRLLKASRVGSTMDKNTAAIGLRRAGAKVSKVLDALEIIENAMDKKKMKFKRIS